MDQSQGSWVASHAAPDLASWHDSSISITSDFIKTDNGDTVHRFVRANIKLDTFPIYLEGTAIFVFKFHYYK